MPPSQEHKIDSRQSSGRTVLLHLSHPIRSLTISFWLWKALLYLVVAASPGPGYDTSTTLLPYQNTTLSKLPTDTLHAPDSIPLRFVRWDSIYFLHIAQEGYVFEQEWAFGYGGLLRLVTSVLNRSDDLSGPAQIGLVGVVFSHVTHYLSVLALYRLSINVFGQETTAKKLICFLSATLHIISPAGAFLSAPYGEPVFSLLNFLGFYIYSSSLVSDRDGRTFHAYVKLIIAAVLFAFATAVRSNGILSGFLFAYDAVLELQRVVTQGVSRNAVFRLFFIILGGSIVALGMMVPQVKAYADYCVRGSRPWCHKTIPSIYGWVQSHYWNVGFLRYWTVSNIPLFLLAMPMLVTLCQSSLWGLKRPFLEQNRSISTVSGSAAPSPSTAKGSFLIRLAVPQGLLAVLALTSYHVQIVNRISSGYPVWYWYITSQLVENAASSKPSSKRKRLFTIIVQAMVVYALVQGVLFGSFLPPA